MGDVGKEFGEDVVLLLYKSADCTCHCQKRDIKRVKTQGKTVVDNSSGRRNATRNKTR